MPKLSSIRVPKYRLHRATGQAVVTINGRDFYLGRHGTKASRDEYKRLIAEWEAKDREPLIPATDLTIVELCAAFWRFSTKWYVKNGRPTDEQACIRAALKPLKNLYGRTAVVKFGPAALKAVRQAMIDAGGSRGYCNKQVSRIRRMFRWAVAEEMIPPHVHQALASVPGLVEGKTEAREIEPVEPVDDATVEATLKFLNPVAADMVRLQKLTGMRPGEVCIMRPCDLDRSGAVWEYRPATHKMEHKNRKRVVYIGPQGQAILAPYILKTEPDRYCFRPPRKPSHARYTLSGYRSAIWYASERAFPPAAPLAILDGESDRERLKRLTPDQQEQLKAWNNSVHWSPNRLRHSAGTE